MKKALIIYIYLLFSLTAQANERYFVTASNGLILRNAPNEQANRIGKMPYGSTVDLLEESNVTFQIKDNGKVIKGQWVKVKFDNFPYEISKDNRKGFVFSGYLEKLNKIETLNLKEMNDVTFNKLYKKVIKPKIRKINTQKEAEKLLGSRVTWINTEFFGRTIDSITLSNGRIMAINQSPPYIFQAYYPSEEVIIYMDEYGTRYPVSLKTGEYGGTVGLPGSIIESPAKKRRLNSWYPGQDCVYYFFQEKIENHQSHLTTFGWGNGGFGRDVCVFSKFYWLNDDDFIYSHITYTKDKEIETYFSGSFKK